MASSVLWTGIETILRFKLTIMDITIFGTGYVGLFSGAGLSLCGDKYAALQGGKRSAHLHRVEAVLRA